jgi:4-hydroxybenzoate polyprenyltransferase
MAVSQLKMLLGFSRVAQASLSVAQPFAAALIALHGFPPIDRLLLGLSAAWAGFLAVFALNDLLDIEVDRVRFAHLRGYDDFDLDSAMVRHPLAQEQLPFGLGAAWVGGLATYALVAAYMLSPIAAGMFVLAALLEAIYCKLAGVTHLKFLVSGAMVGVGALAGWIAMTSEVRLLEFALVFLWMAAWEMGGRNITNDFADVEEDERLGVKTVPLVYGPKAAAFLTLALILLTNGAALALTLVSHLNIACLVGMAAAGLLLLLLPALKLIVSPTPQNALSLFNRASFYPPVALAVLIVSLYLPFY